MYFLAFALQSDVTFLYLVCPGVLVNAVDIDRDDTVFYEDISFIPFTGRLLAVLIRLLDFREREAGLAWLILVFSQIRTAEQDEITGIIKHQVAFDTVRKRVFRLFN